MTSNSRIQLPIHEHGLILRDLSQHLSLDCDICHLPGNSGPTYQCPDCDSLLLIHKSCVESADAQIQHPSHPDHPLILSEIPSSASEYCCERCLGCNRPIYNVGYKCCAAVCNVHLHVTCAVATLPIPALPEGQLKEAIHHIVHEHPLESFQINVRSQFQCKVCREPILGLVYGCRSCMFIMHEKCALLPPKLLEHPFHPQHSLTLQFRDYSFGFSCKACFKLAANSYHCDECEFHLDTLCASSVLRHPPDNDQDGDRESRDKKAIQHFSHPHPLISHYATGAIRAKCRLCWTSISGNFYCCSSDCLFIVHESCVAELQQKIIHPLHPEHALIFQIKLDQSEGELLCYLCQNILQQSHPIFSCAECFTFNIHVDCVVKSLLALRTRVPPPTIQKLFGESARLTLRTHEECETCRICGFSILGLGYRFQGQRGFVVIHVSCAEVLTSLNQHEFQVKWKHCFHPKHPVILHWEPPKKNSLCNACVELCHGTTFSCEVCDFQMHWSCALKKPTLKHQRHEHELTYFEKIGRHMCNLCYGYCSMDLYRCVPCDYDIHYGCMYLPQSVKHEWHIHPLVLRDRVVDDFYDEQYCDLCETTRHPEHGVYYCDECRCANHIHCVIDKDEERKLVEDLFLLNLDEEIASMNENIVLQKAEMEELNKKLEISSNEHERIESKRRQIMQEKPELDCTSGMNSVGRILHPEHEHSLVFLRGTSENCSIICNICKLPVKNSPAYRCPECNDGFLVHKVCIELAPRIHHPSHPEHPLIRGKVPQSGNCHECDIQLYFDGYVCEACDVFLHTSCAAETLLPHETECKIEEEIIQHFAHEHSLTSFDMKEYNCLKCEACQGKLSGLVYRCRSCLFMLHKSCALLPREMLEHPLHPKHPLTLVAGFDCSHKCEACGNCKRFAYRCDECDFSLDVGCATSIVHGHMDRKNLKGQEPDSQVVHHFSHPHQLAPLHATMELPIKCQLCKVNISGNFCCCPDCCFMLHKSCAESSQNIAHHPFHPEHPLIYQQKYNDSLGKSICQICRVFPYFLTSDPIFICNECSFVAHVFCTTHTLSSLKAGAALAVNNYKLLPNPWDRDLWCWICNETIGPVGYRHAHNYLDLHIECADLPSELEHPFHPQHRLILYEEPQKVAASCNACLGRFRYKTFTYYCDYCEFQVHPCCLKHKVTEKHPRHEHELTYFEEGGNCLCNVCYEDCSFDFYRCVPCNYNLHYGCSYLPPSVKHELHIHPMLLQEKFINDCLPADEQYCDLCETIRHTEHGVYYCDECCCAAHIDCVIPKDKRRELGAEFMLQKLDEEFASASTKIEKLKAEAEGLKIKLESLHEELASLKNKKQELEDSQMQG